MKRNEIYLEVPSVGEVLLEPFKYSNGRKGYMIIEQTGIAKTISYNLTLNSNTVETRYMILKMYDQAEPVARHLLSKTDMFTKVGTASIGRNIGQIVSLNEDYYEKE